MIGLIGRLNAAWVLNALGIIKPLADKTFDFMPFRQDMAAEEQRARAPGLDADELAFYDAVAVNFFGLYDEAFLRDLIHDVVHTVKNNLKVDWTQPHRKDIKATVRKQMRRRNVQHKDLEPFLGYILDQAKEMYADWRATVSDER